MLVSYCQSAWEEQPGTLHVGMRDKENIFKAALLQSVKKKVTLLGDEQLVPNFVQAYYAAQAALTSGDRQAATKAYQDLLALYKQLAASSLEKLHKDLAHQQVKKIYDGLALMPQIATPTPSVQESQQQPRPGGFGAKDYLMIGFFGVLIIMVLFFKPEYIGLAFAEIPVNSPPEWRGTQTVFKVQAGSSIALDLSYSFRDPEGDSLVYLATEHPGLEVSVTGKVVTINALPGAFGEHPLVFIASDLVNIVKVPVTIIVV